MFCNCIGGVYLMIHVHLIGIGGTGISSIARVLLERGYKVSGSDRVLSPLARELQAVGVAVYEGHQAANIQDADLIVRSSAIPDDNAEVQAALVSGIPVLKRADFLGNLMADDFSIAVAGSHGKTTTSAMMAWVLTCLKQDPTFILGGVSKNLNTNAHAGSGKYFVIEADEYDRMFLGLNQDVILLTNVGYDHPDCFPTIGEYELAFRDFINNTRSGGMLVANEPDAKRLHLIQDLPVTIQGLTYGFSQEANYQATNLKLNSQGCFNFEVHTPIDSKGLAVVNMSIPGEHNVLNALGVFSVLHQLGFAPESIAAALSDFLGTGRRFEIVGEVSGITIIDDYAHHPAKVKATLAAAKNRFPGRRIIAVWQPHTYSRTKALASEFSASFENADLVIVSEIFASRENLESFSANEVVKNITSSDARFIASLTEISSFLIHELRSGDVVIVLSAGDANQVCIDVLSALQERKVNNG
jgi:UDP-N-acetylmuramate--alanine ligase